MKRKLILWALMSMFTVVAVSSCNKDDDEDSGIPTSTFDGKLSGTITGATAGQIDSIGVDYVGGVRKFPVSATGTFDFTLPTPAAGDLESFDVSPTATVTPADAKIFTTYFGAYKEGEYVGDVYKISGATELSYVYANKDVTIVGTEGNSEYSASYNCSLKAGWNILKTVTSKTNSTETDVVTTGNIPNIPWVFEEW
ncbi:MAG: hypothetical protein LBT50_08800 [Prevotellaceae bacterium]|nr:hypothetical protein [Prevotellaceae bacterium]